ncbi:amidohydrolase family protein [Nitriliruptoraceae bacterium ZYF776]|nr:amidohydrolase family protein [Profundirhabdus halotolerans]
MAGRDRPGPGGSRPRARGGAARRRRRSRSGGPVTTTPQAGAVPADRPAPGTARPKAGPRGTLLVADRVITLGHGRATAHAVLVRGSRVVWVGDDPAAAPPHQHRLELDGAVLGPAFVDAHAHLTPTGLARTGLDLTEVRSGAELLRTVATYAAQHTGRVIWGHGFDPHGFPDELPSPDDLAEVTPGRAVYLSRIDGHASLVDLESLSAAPLARAAGVERDAAGRATGVLRREANNIARRWAVGAMDTGELDAARHAAARHAASLGIGSVHEMAGPDIMGLADLDAWIDGDWPIEVVPYWGDLDLGVPAARELRQAGGDLFLDGSLGAHTAALCAAYTDRPDEQGELELDDATLTEWFTEATHAGIQVGVHAIGDAALRQVVRCWHAVRASSPDHLGDAIPRLRHRVEHAEVLPLDLLDDLAELGIVISAQPSFEALWGGRHGMYASRLGERARGTNPYRAIADRGIGIAFGSDSNVGPLDPWRTVHAAEHRAFPEHDVSRLEAVSMSTLGGRHAARQDRYAGPVRAGMRADLAAFADDPYAADDPRGAPCVLTIVQGRVTHGEAPLPR